MNTKGMTLIEFFSFDSKQLSEEHLSKLESDNNISSLKEALSKKIEGKKWPLALKELIKKAEELLRGSLLDIMVDAWEKYQSISECMDKSKDSPDETFLLPLAEHEIHSEHNPYVEILLNEKSIGKVQFTIDISLVLKGMILKIKQGEILELQTGACEGKGSFVCEDIVLFEKKLEPVQMPGTIVLQKERL